MSLGNLPQSVQYAIGGIFGLLVITQIIVAILRRLKPDADYTELSLRVRTWWVMAGVFALAMVLSRTISLLFLAFVSFLAVKEYFSLIPTRRADRRAIFWAYLAIPIQFYWVYHGWYGMFIVFIPVYMFLFLPFRMIMIGETESFLRSTAQIHWGLMLMVFNLSHAAFLLVLKIKGNPIAIPGPGLLLYLVFLTQANDIFQYIWGKLLGKRKIIPKISPNKTWAGFIGGVVSTTACAVLLGEWLTPFDRTQSLAAGLIIGLGGFVGDINISALKRDLGIKDTSGLLPGHGGILDRVDSLTFTAPLFFHYVYWLFLWESHGA